MSPVLRPVMPSHQGSFVEPWKVASSMGGGFHSSRGYTTNKSSACQNTGLKTRWRDVAGGTGPRV